MEWPVRGPKQDHRYLNGKSIKFQRLDSFKTSGNIMFGMELFDVIDLTDKSSIISISEKDRGTPSTIKYKIINSIIEFSEYVSLKIVNVTQDTLTLNLIVNLEQGNVSVKGEAVEMKFVQMKELEWTNNPI